MWAGLADIGAGLTGDIRVVVVRGEGPSFSAGLDRAYLASGRLAELAGGPRAAERIAQFQAGFTWLSRPDLVSIAAVQGHAIGAGFQLALACDLRVAASDASFRMAEPSFGIVPDLGGTKPLVDLVGYARALEICLTSRQVGAAEALEIGLVNLVVPPGELAAATADLAGVLAAAPRDAAIETKVLLRGAADRSLPAQCEAEREAQLRLLGASEA